MYTTCFHFVQTEFAIQIPGTRGGSLGDSEIVNLEERNETHHNTLSLGPAVVTDDEGSRSSRFNERSLNRGGHEESKMDKAPPKHQQIKKIRRHRRTASTGSNVIYIPQKDAASSSTTLPSSSKPAQQMVLVRPKPLTAKQQVSRPGSAGSNPAVAVCRIQSPERIRETAHEVVKGITKLIHEGEGAGDVGEVGGGGEGAGGGAAVGEKTTRMRRVRSGGVKLEEGVSGDTGEGGGSVGVGEGEGSVFSKPDHPPLQASVTASLPAGFKTKSKHETPRNKPSKASDATETPPTTDPPLIGSSAATTRKMTGGSSRPSATSWLRIFSSKEKTATRGSGGGGGTGSGEAKTVANPQLSSAISATGSATSGTTDPPPPPSSAAPATVGSAGHNGNKLPATFAADLSRTPSILSTTSSTISTFPPSTLPSRNPSFAYDGGGESSPHSLESVEIGDSIENLLALQCGRMNYSYFIPIRTTKDTTSSSDEDSVRGYRHSRRKRSSGTNTDATAHSTQQSKGVCVYMYMYTL